MYNGRTIGFKSDKHVRYEDVKFSIEGMEIIVRTIWLQADQLKQVFEFPEHKKRSIFIRGVFDNITAFESHRSKWLDGFCEYT